MMDHMRHDPGRSILERPAAGPPCAFADGRRPARRPHRLPARIGPRIAAAIEELRRQGPIAAGLVSDRRVSDAEVLAAELGTGFPSWRPDFRREGRPAREFRNRGLKIAYVGDCRREPAVAREVHVAISLAEDFDPEHDPGQILILRPDFDWLPAFESSRWLTLGESGSLTARSCSPTCYASREPSSLDSRASRPSLSRTSAPGRSTQACQTPAKAGRRDRSAFPILSEVNHERCTARQPRSWPVTPSDTLRAAGCDGRDALGFDLAVGAWRRRASQRERSSGRG